MSARTILQCLLCRTLSPAAFACVQLKWRESSFNLQTARSWFVTRAPKIDAFDAKAKASELSQRIRDVNVLARTKLCRIMLRSGSDKSYHSHNYTTVYWALFDDLRNEPLRIFELGLGSNNTAIAFHMGGIPGASLRGWRELFPRAQIFGADIDRSIQIDEDRIKTFYCDQLDRDSIRSLWSEPELKAGVDIIIEDGLHTFEGNTSFLEGSLEHLNPGGIYAIEDIVEDTTARWLHQVRTAYVKRYPDCEFVFAHLPTYPDVRDNNLLIIRRHAVKQTSPEPVAVSEAG